MISAVKAASSLESCAASIGAARLSDMPSSVITSQFPGSNDGYASNSHRLRRLSAYADKAGLNKKTRPASVQMWRCGSRPRDALSEFEYSVLIGICRLIVVCHM